MGLFTLEEVRFSQTGVPWTTGPGAYKIPGFSDIPLEFYVHLLQSAPNKHAIYSSKVKKHTPFKYVLDLRGVCFEDFKGRSFKRSLT